MNMAEVTPAIQMRKLPAIAKFAMRVQATLLRHNLMGAMGDEIMVITVTGRKSGKQYSTPIGYLRDGESIIALTNGGLANWYKNVLSIGRASLEIKGKPIPVCAEPIADQAERERIFEIYKRERARNFRILFGVPRDSSAEELAKALATRVLVRFTAVNN
jgi:deazaflavin-dependent oxidoreductase (nitroreductase family)